jgi:hypothetical protein
MDDLKKSPVLNGNSVGKAKVKKCFVVNSDIGVSPLEGQGNTGVFFAFSSLVKSFKT